MFTPPSTKTIIIFLISLFNHLLMLQKKVAGLLLRYSVFGMSSYTIDIYFNPMKLFRGAPVLVGIANTNTVYHRVAGTFQMIHIPPGVISSPSAPTNPSGNRKSVDCSCELLQSFVFLSASCSTNLL